MVRQYKIHTDLDGAENRTFDMTNGLIRFYQPSDLGIINSTNIWQSQGIGVMGNNNISHPDIDFKFETFGNSLEENYRIFNEFINSIIKQKYITLQYTNEIGTFYADIQLSKITKTEGYGFDGQFSETISFIPVNMWYVYEQLKFSKVQNGEIGGNTKIYGNKETTVYPNLNLLSNSKFPDDKLTSPWGNYANGGTVVISNGEYNYTTPSTGTGSGKQGGLNYTDTSIMTTQKSYVWSAKVKGSGSVRITYQYTYTDGTTSSWIQGGDTTLTSDYSLAKAIISPQTKAFTKVGLTLYFQGASTGSIKEPKLEEGSTATPWMPSASEVQPSDYRNYGSYKYDYTYFGEDNIERFSKWKIDDGIFSFTARMTPSQNVENMSDYGVRFLDEQFNEYTALIFGNTTKPDSIQFNTDVNDEYYQAQIGTSTINMFSALNYQRFRTRLIQKGTMELVNVDVVEMNVKRKVEFV